MSVLRAGKFVSVALLVVAAFVGGAAVGVRPVVEYGQQVVNAADHPRDDVPRAADEPYPREPRAGTAFCRPRENTRVFAFESHDPMVARENGTHYLVVGTDTDPSLYRSGSPTNPDSWTLVDADYLTDRFEFDSVVEVDGRYVVYGNGDVYTAESLATDAWTRRNDNTGFRDLGAYYDEETGLVHVYYEYGDAAGYSGKKIGHAVSPDGVTNWTVYPPVWTAPDGYGVGDFDIVERDGVLYVFGDYDPHHPRYNVSVWVNDDPYSEFTRLDDHAVTHRLGETQYDDDYGVGDPTVVRLGDGRFLVLANGYAGPSAPARLHYYVGTIGSDAEQSAPAC